MYIVFDTNVYVSAFVYKGVPEEALTHATEHHTIVASPYIFDEIYATLVSKKFNWSALDIDNTLDAYVSAAILVEDDIIADIARDPKDDPILACAIAGEADYLVTGDKDLLTLKRYKGTRIITPRQFMEIA